MHTLFMHCRPGFEGEVCSEISEHAARLNVAGYAKAKPPAAYAEFVCTEEDGAERLMHGQRLLANFPPAMGARGVHRPAGNRPHQRDPRAVWRASRRAAACGWKWSIPTMAKSCRISAEVRSAAAQGADQAGKLVEDEHKPRLLLTFKSGREVFRRPRRRGQLGDVADGHSAFEVPA